MLAHSGLIGSEEDFLSLR